MGPIDGTYHYRNPRFTAQPFRIGTWVYRFSPCNQEDLKFPKDFNTACVVLTRETGMLQPLVD